MNKEGVLSFVEWTKLKVRIHLTDVQFFPRERQIWWVSIGYNIGVETNGKNENFERPVLVLKRYNSESCLIVPLSSKIKYGGYYFKLIVPSGQENTVNLSQVRTISVKRFIRKITKIEETDFIQIKSLLKNTI